MIIHYSQITLNPAKYRTDCEAIGGRILDCNYRSFFYELQQNPEAAMKVVMASKVIWNLMVRSTYKELGWLRYDFWSLRVRISADPFLPLTPENTTEATPSVNIDHPDEPAKRDVMRLLYLYEDPGSQTSDALLEDFEKLGKIDTAADLSEIIDSSITSHFFDQGTAVFLKTVEEFFQCNDNLIEHESMLCRVNWDWTRYLRFLTLYAYRISLKSSQISTPKTERSNEINGNSFLSVGPEKTTSILGPHYDRFQNVSFTNSDKYLPIPSQPTPSNCLNFPIPQFNTSMYPNSQQQGVPVSVQNAIKKFKVNPVPTMAISLLLYAHRTSFNRYFQTLSLLGIQKVGITWEENNENIKATQVAWKALYDEVYVVNIQNFRFKGKSASRTDLPLRKVSTNRLTTQELHTSSADALISDGSSKGKVDYPIRSENTETQQVSCYSAQVKPMNSILSKRTGKKPPSGFKKVLFCTGLEF
ncbi:unnamed protein product [Phytomonas sp. Hart1]|nr:unnamed protein product [Phytomonas sp. Hart1]|eukprot:CCW71183.1 unnamed protein product [Phytomonas sp. isolate Hart1]